MENRVVIFDLTGKNPPRILHGVNPSEYYKRNDAVVNPKFPRGVPPHQWKLVNGEIVAMDELEKRATAPKVYVFKPRPMRKRMHIGLAAFALGVVVGALPLLLRLTILHHL